jgi:hypothetical protein
MIKPLLLFIAFFGPYLFQDVRVATFSTGKTNTATYESLSFWIKGNKRAYIRYSHGKEAEDLDLSYQGPDNSSGKPGFRALFPGNKHSFYIQPAGDTLLVTDQDQRKRSIKYFVWEDEGNSADSLSNCSICAQDEQDAMDIVKKYFLK